MKVLTGRPSRHGSAARAGKHTTAWLFALVWVVYAFYANGWAGNPMGKSIVDLTFSVVDHRTVAIDPYAGNSVDIARRGGHFYSGMPPGMSFLAIPIYVAAKPALAFIPEGWNARAAEIAVSNGKENAPTPRRAEVMAMTILLILFVTAPAAAASVVLLLLIWKRIWGDRFAQGILLLSATAFAFGTLHFYYGSNVEHRVVSGMMVLAAFYLLLGERAAESQKVERIATAGFLLGVAVTVSYEAAISASAVGAFLLPSLRRRVFWLAAGAALPLMLLSLYHAAAFGSPFATAYSFRATASQNLVDNQGFRLWLDPGVIGQYLVGFNRGVFFFSPVLLLGIFPLFKRRVPKEVVLGWVVFGAALAFHYVTGYEAISGGSYGFRQMMGALPFAAIGLPMGIAALGRRRWVAGALAAFGFAMAMRGLIWGIPGIESGVAYAFGRWGLSTYSLRQISERVLYLSPWMVSALHVAGLATVVTAALVVRRSLGERVTKPEFESF